MEADIEALILTFVIGTVLWSFLITLYRKNRISTRHIIVLLALIGIILRIIFAAETPIGMNSDEPAHYNYISYISTNYSLPVFEIVEPETMEYEYYQPPVYYLLLTPIHWIANKAGVETNNIYLMLRAANILIWLLTFILSVKTFKRLGWFEKQQIPAFGSLAIISLLPHYISISSGINNSNLPILFITCVSYYLAHDKIRNRQWAIIGLLVGLTVLTKMSGGVVGIFVAAYIIYGYYINQQTLRDTVLASLTSGGIAIGLWSIRAARNIHYHNEAILVEMGSRLWENPPRMLSDTVILFLTELTDTFWASSGPVLQFRLSGIAIGGVLWTFAIIGHIDSIISQNELFSGKISQQWFISGVFMLIANLLAIFRMADQVGNVQGRFLFPSLLFVGIITAVGLREFGLQTKIMPIHFVGGMTLYAILFTVHRFTQSSVGIFF
ncbi:hypothetical protein DM826_07170 [Halonotius aquaticus]|uniref:Glycosyltransferase RgtA/B/C/D-like domain-containing protein n=1 Tax=Halonotius aquaticus TaxID=2216978 RepID=A0A3A6PP66_9EURY|nr:glycosyltransferase family 39 protein [Halonotius aquaticus]RJX43381.1 hypothetical protein DM826_07170 [Halonotius aquaticus]